jgi:FtsP/CotA-like multicopper oxidase with cupredoxin domain
MSKTVSRRDFLGGALGAGMLPAAAQGASSNQRLVAGTRVLEVNGRAARAFRLTGPDGSPGLLLAPDERFRVDLANESGARTLVHWHGQLPPWIQDGFPWPQSPPIANGAVQAYDYAPIAGTYWMHSHVGMQEQSLMTAPLIVQDTASLREDRQEVVLFLHDFTFRSPEEVLAGLTGGGEAAPAVVAHQPAMGPGRRAPMGNMANMTGREMAGMAMSGDMASMTPKAGGMQIDLNDVQYDAFLANDRTLGDPEIVRLDRGGRVRLRVINGASSSQFWIDLGALTGRVIATDGHDVQPIAGSRFPIAMAQRLDILIDLSDPGAYPILAQLEGSARRTGIVLATADAHIPRIADEAQSAAPALDLSLEGRLAAANPLSPRLADIVRSVVLGGAMKPYAWSMDDEYWPRITPIMIDSGQRVEFELVNRTMMAHPIHLHGHAFQVSPRHRARHADAPCPDRLRRRQPGEMGFPLSQSLSHGNRNDDRSQISRNSRVIEWYYGNAVYGTALVLPDARSRSSDPPSRRGSCRESHECASNATPRYCARITSGVAAERRRRFGSPHPSAPRHESITPSSASLRR